MKEHVLQEAFVFTNILNFFNGLFILNILIFV